VKDERAYRLARARGELDNDTGMVPTKSPMPGVIVNVLVEVGQMISKGETMVILESMKMENELKATRDGKVFEIKVSAGQTVEKDALLVVVGDEEPAE
ncbi:MAG: biotin carboxyl carrier protein, partial [Cellvibrionaceae bacterium]